mmetsp:Transcript_21291/g.26870  ORF Transcript_21291/g.26870 Transcript_21291/m.26870 type:complete len:149 (-) Transcript_21291:91-537(-)
MESTGTEAGKKYPDLDGWVKVEREPNAGDLIINYFINNGPIQCDDCRLGIFTGSKCSMIDSAQSLFDPDEVPNPWRADKGAQYVTNNKGTGAGFINVFNGRGFRQHTCMLVGLFDSRDDNVNAHMRSRAIGCARLIPEGQDKDFCEKY